MPDPAGTTRNARDVALKALIKAVALPVLVVVFNAVRNGWSTSMAALTLGIGVPLLWIALFAADYYIQPAVERRNAQRRAPQRPSHGSSSRNSRNQNGGNQSGRGQNGNGQSSRGQSSKKQGNKGQGSRGQKSGKGGGKKSQRRR